jgi:Kef-type K+ transport system membrane component KefB
VLQRGVDRLFVGIGMIPRGEVGLVVASLGLHTTIGGAPAMSAAAYSAAVVMIVATTLVTPPLLAWRARRAPQPHVPH